MKQVRFLQSFRARLLAVVAITTAVSVIAVAWAVDALTERSFAQAEERRTSALTAHYQREFQRQGAEIAAHTESIARTQATLDLVLDATNADSDQSRYVHEA